MATFSFSVPTQIRFGAGVSLEAGTITKSLLMAGGNGPTSAVLVILDPGVKGTRWLDQILESLPACGLQYEEFEDVKPNPREEDVYKAAALLAKNHSAGVIAIGGGSTIDTGKMAALIATYHGKVGDYAGWAKVPGPTLRTS